MRSLAVSTPAKGDAWRNAFACSEFFADASQAGVNSGHCQLLPLLEVETTGRIAAFRSLPPAAQSRSNDGIEQLRMNAQLPRDGKSQREIEFVDLSMSSHCHDSTINKANGLSTIR